MCFVFPLFQEFHYDIFRPEDQSHVIDFDEEEGVTNRIVIEGEEEEREDIADI